MTQTSIYDKYHILMFIKMVNTQNNTNDSLSKNITTMNLKRDDIKSRQGATQKNTNIVYK